MGWSGREEADFLEDEKEKKTTMSQGSSCTHTDRYPKGMGTTCGRESRAGAAVDYGLLLRGNSDAMLVWGLRSARSLIADCEAGVCSPRYVTPVARTQDLCDRRVFSCDIAKAGQ